MNIKRLLALMMAAMLLAGCLTAAAAEEPMKIVLCLRNYQSPPEGWNEACEKLKEIALEQGNFDLEIICEASSTMNTTLTNMFTANETVDVLMAAQTRYSPLVAQGMVLPLDDLLAEYGQGIIKTFEGCEDMLKAGMFNGELYGVTPYTKKAKANNFLCRTDLLEKYGLSLDGVKDYKDLEPILAVIKANEPDIYPLSRSSASLAITAVKMLGSEEYDTSDYILIGNSWGVLMDDTWDVVNLYETQAYYDVCATLHDWYLKGYMVPDIATLPADEQGAAAFSTGKVFGVISNHDANPIWSASTWGKEYPLTACTIGPGEVAMVGFLVGIGSTTSDPVNAMKFMNFAWTNEDFNTILHRGTKYRVVDEEKKILGYPEGETYVEYISNGFADMFGNFTLAWQWDTDPENYAQSIIESNRSATVAKTIGFSFDSTNVTNQMAACQSVYDQYYQPLENGLLDPAVAIPEFVKAMKDAGIDDIIAEKQRQLDAWVKVNGY